MINQEAATRFHGERVILVLHAPKVARSGAKRIRRAAETTFTRAAEAISSRRPRTARRLIRSVESSATSAKETAMNKLMSPRLGAASGAVFALVLFIASGNGDHSFSTLRAIAGVAAITLALPFIAYISQLLRDAEGANGWLAPAAFAGGVIGIGVKLVSIVPELAIHRAQIADGTQIHKALQEMADGATVLCLYPLALFCAATAIVALRTQVLPRWLGAGAAVTAAALVVNGGFFEASFVPALLLFIAWTLVTSIYLIRRNSRNPARVSARAGAAA
jgi:hypothetical protein